MKRNNWIWIILGAIAITSLSSFTGSSMNYNNILQNFLPDWEGFSPTPFWDYKQWTWGYGTKVPGSSTNPNIKPQGTITQQKAIEDTLTDIQGRFAELNPLVQVSLKPQQWAAFLSFAYNLGIANAKNLVQYINSQDLDTLEDHWKRYIYAGGQISQGLINRRNAEWELFTS